MSNPNNILQGSIREKYYNLYKEFLEKDYSYEKINRSAGRKYDTPKDLAEKCYEYFTITEEMKKPFTISGLRLHCNFLNDKDIYEYQRVKQFTEDFNKVVQISRLLIRNYNEEGLYSKTRYQGSRFVMQCLYGWLPGEKQYVENKNIEVTIGSKKEENNGSNTDSGE